MHHQIQKKSFRCFLLTCLFLLLFSVSAFAAAPGKVGKVTATAGEQSVSLSWKAISGASGYYVYLKDTTTGEDTIVATVKAAKNPSVLVKKLKVDTKYSFCVAAYKKSGTKVTIGTKSSRVSATTAVVTPATPSVSVTVTSETAKLSWSAIKYATGYQIYVKAEDDEHYSLLKTVTKTKVTIKGLTNNTNYKFRVRAIREVLGQQKNGAFCKAVNAKPMDVSDEVAALHGMYYKATLTKQVLAKTTDGSSTKTIKKGTTVTVTYRVGSGNCKVLYNKKTYYVNSKYLNYQSCIYDSKKSYTAKVAEGYVNSKGYKSTTKYLVWVSTYNQHLYVFKGSQGNWELYETYICTTGKANTPTRRGVYRIYQKADRGYYTDENTHEITAYFNNACYFHGEAIHGWTHYLSGTIVPGIDRIGNPQSSGCVRLREEIAKKFHDYIPMYTTVVVF